MQTNNDILLILIVIILVLTIIIAVLMWQVQRRRQLLERRREVIERENREAEALLREREQGIGDDIPNPLFRFSVILIAFDQCQSTACTSCRGIIKNVSRIFIGRTFQQSPDIPGSNV